MKRNCHKALADIDPSKPNDVKLLNGMVQAGTY
jgi:hypothetical protein